MAPCWMGLDLPALQSFFPGRDWSSKKRFRSGTHRISPPSETLVRLSGIAQRIGVTRVANITGLDRIGIPVVTVCRPRNRSLSVYQGKGLTMEAAKVSGLMESVERFCGEYLRPPDFSAPYSELPPNLHKTDYDIWPEPSGGVRDSNVEIGWIAGYDILQARAVYVPYPVVHFDKRRLRVQGDEQFENASTGLSCGNSFAEALVHALCEVVERDALTLWRLRPAPHRAATRISLTSISDEDCLALIRRLREAHVGCAVWETTGEIGIPSFLCRIVEVRDDGYRPSDLVDGSGCHPSREVALSRAITEAIQIRGNAIAGARNDLFRARYIAPAPSAIEAARNSIGRCEGGRQFEESCGVQSGSPVEDLLFVLDQLRPHVRHAIAINLAHPDADSIPAVRVLVPELEDGEEMDRYRPRTRAMRSYLGR